MIRFVSEARRSGAVKGAATRGTFALGQARALPAAGDVHHARVVTTVY